MPDLAAYFCGARPGDLAGGYDMGLVALSIAIAIIGSYTAVDLAGRARHSKGSAGQFWLVLSAIAMGGSIWSMHFVAMLAFDLPVPIGYDVDLTLLSLLVAILVSGIGLAIVGRQAGNTAKLVIGGTIMGVGVASMHYTGMAAMRMSAQLSFDWRLYTVSIVIAIAASVAALWLAFTLERAWMKAAASVVMAAAIAGMHFTGMAGAHFTPAAHALPVNGGTPVPLLAMVIAVATFSLLVIGLVSSYADRRLAAQMDREAEASRLGERRLRSILDTALDAFIAIDAGGRITFWNLRAELIFGWSRNEAIGRLMSEMIVPERLRDAHLRGMRRFLQTRQGRIFNSRREFSALHRDGHEFPIELTIAPTWVDDQVTINAFIQDISERKKAESDLIEAKDQAEAANRAKSVFLTNMSHELRTPLNAVIGFSELICHSLASSGRTSKIGEYAADIYRSGLHLLDLINDILDLSSAEAGRLTINEAVCDIVEIITASASTVRAAAQTGQVTLDVAADDRLPRLVGDARRLRQILINLLSNAVKFTPRNGRVTMRVSKLASGELEFTITDTGIGMTPAQIRIALTPFAQVDDQLARKFEGTGLGLPLVQQLLALHQGQLDIRSTPGVGTTAMVRFPAHRLRALDVGVHAGE